MSETRQELDQNERLAVIEANADLFPCHSFWELSKEFYWLCLNCYRSDEDHAMADLERKKEQLAEDEAEARLAFEKDEAAKENYGG